MNYDITIRIGSEIKAKKERKEELLPVQGVFVEIGLIPKKTK